MKTAIILILLVPLFIIPASAEDLYGAAADAIGADAMEQTLSDEEREISGELKTDGSYDVRGALTRLWDSIITSARDELRENLAFASALVAIGMLCAAADTLCANEGIRRYIELAACCAAAATLIGSVDSITEQTVQALGSVSDYSKAALPALYTAAAACGAMSSSAAKYAAVCLATDVFMDAAQKIIVPLIYAYTAGAVANGMLKNALLTNVVKLMKWAAVTVMTGMTAAFCAYIGMTGLVTESVDAAAVKAAKTAISAALPVVGGIVSDASGTVVAAIKVIRGASGAFGLIAACAICAGPFAALSVKLLALKAAAAVSDSISCGSFSSLISDIAGAMAMLLGLLGCCGIMLFISIMAGIKTVSA